MVDKNKEEEFFAKAFNFSYSSLNRLLFSPSLFYKDYILKEKEIRLDKHLIEGSVIHCLLFEADKLNEKFKIVPGKTPSDSVKLSPTLIRNSAKPVMYSPAEKVFVGFILCAENIIGPYMESF